MSNAGWGTIKKQNETRPLVRDKEGRGAGYAPKPRGKNRRTKRTPHYSKANTQKRLLLIKSGNGPPLLRAVPSSNRLKTKYSRRIHDFAFLSSWWGGGAIALEKTS